MKLSSSRAAFPVKRAIQNPRSVCNRSSLRSHAKHRPHHSNARKTRDPDRTPHRPQHRRNRDGVRTYSRQRRQQQRCRSRQNRSRNVLPQLCQHRKMHRDRHRKHLVCARMIYDCALNRKRRSIRQSQHHKSLDGVLLFKRRQKILQKRLFRSRCQIVRLYPMCRQPRNRRAPHGERAHTTGTAEIAQRPSANSTRARTAFICAAGKEIPRRKSVCVG